MTLEVRVDSAASGGLRIIDHIPALRPCRLEGKNGIGKSALVRLLTLLSGVQPFADDKAAWLSLRRLVGSTQVSIGGLTGEHSSATVRLTPALWPEDPEEVGSWLGTLTLDGREERLSALFEEFTVVHLSGTEKLADTLKQQTGRLALELNGVSERLNELNEQRAELGELGELLRFVSPNEAHRERDDMLRAVADRRQTKDQITSMRTRAEDLARAHALTALVETGDAAEHQQRITDLRERLGRAREAMTAAEQNHDKAVAALAKGSTAHRQVAKLERRLGVIQKSMDRLLASQEDLGLHLDVLGIPTDVDQLDADQRESLDAAVSDARAHQRRIQVEAARNNRSAAENRLLDDVGVVLDDAVASGLEETVLARVDDSDISVGGLRAGLGFVADVEGPEPHELSSVAARLAGLVDLSELFEQRARLQAEVVELHKELALLNPKVAAHDELRDNASDARKALDEASAEVRRHTIEIGALSRSVLGGTDVSDVEEHISDLLTKHDVEAEDLAAATTQSQTDLLDLQSRESHLGKQIDQLSGNATRRRLAREKLRRPGEKLQWVRALAASIDSAVEDSSDDWPDAVWQQLAVHVEASKVAFDQLVNDVSGLRVLAASSKFQTGRLGAAMRSVVESEAQVELSARPIVDALFDGGEVRRVSLDDDASTITWTTPGGETRTRPLAVFSSGQQALGFMRARLQQIADDPKPNRLVFLDEFGAFISADSRRPLADLLTSVELKALSEQVVVILPLQADYENELDQTTGTLRDRYLDRARAIKAHGYFTEPFVG